MRVQLVARWEIQYRKDSVRTCWGITKQFQFCKRPTEDNFYCDEHRIQLKYFFTIAITSILFSYVAGLLPIPWKKDVTSEKLIRPMVVFDPNHKIISDSGAMEHIEKIDVLGNMVDLSVGSVKRPKEIIIYPKRYLSIQPLLTSLDEAYEITAERGELYAWRFMLRETGYVMNESKIYRFSLDIS
jgi:hypothetical protein